MKREHFLYGLGGIIIGGFLSALVFINFIGTDLLRSASPSLSLQRGFQNSDSLDAHFIEQMIPHHEDAITMAKLAQTKANRPEVQELARNIIDSQGKEITQMKSWYREWFGKELPTGSQVMNIHGMMSNRSGMHMGMMGDVSDLQKLELSADFDKDFIEQMIPHHQMAVMMASMLKGGTQRPEMKKLVDDIITTQTKEIEQMREWLKSW